MHTIARGSHPRSTVVELLELTQEPVQASELRATWDGNDVVSRMTRFHDSNVQVVLDLPAKFVSESFMVSRLCVGISEGIHCHETSV